MNKFRHALDAACAASGAAGVPDAARRWLFVSYDQLSDGIGPLASGPPEGLGIVLVESGAKANRRPYHKQKLAFVLANLRHFAIEQARRGIGVRHLQTAGGYASALVATADELGPLVAMEPAERELRAELAPLVERGALEIVPHEGWLTTAAHFEAAADGAGCWRMDRFYRAVRRDLGVLMDGGSPEGGKYSFDAENRKPWSGEPPAPEPPTFAPDEVTIEVADFVSRAFRSHPGRLSLDRLPATAEDAHALWTWALERALPHFGPYEDAMSTASTGLFHTRISPLLNVCRLLARDVVDDVLATDLPLQTREGFVRQVIGWREFVRHVHRATDGFRRIEGVRGGGEPGDAGYSAWTGMGSASGPTVRADTAEGRAGGDAPPRPDVPPGEAAPEAEGVDGGADPTGLETEPIPLPPAFWGTPSGLACLDTVVGSVWEEAWSHHITRLMVLCNIATLLGVSPRQLTDWFWVAYMDAFDWVVEPNVLGMGTFAVGDLMTTKPYVSGASYIRRMSDYCGSCAFDPTADCPLIRLYWAFLERHREALAGNPRLRLPLANARKRSEDDRERDLATFRRLRAILSDGVPATPASSLDS